MRGLRHVVALPLFLAWAPSMASGQSAPSQQINVVANDYAFSPLPSTILAGPTIFTFANNGTVQHEVAIARLKATTSVDAFVKTPPGPERSLLIERSVGILIAGPGNSPDGKLWVDLTKGATYIVLCNFRDKPDAPQHMVLGMYTSFKPQ
jgi:plastocyanin